jgi:hypothetical protein
MASCTGSLLLVEVLSHGLISASRCALRRSFCIVHVKIEIGSVCFLTNIRYSRIDVEHAMDCFGDIADDDSSVLAGRPDVVYCCTHSSVIRNFRGCLLIRNFQLKTTFINIDSAWRVFSIGKAPCGLARCPSAPIKHEVTTYIEIAEGECAVFVGFPISITCQRSLEAPIFSSRQYHGPHVLKSIVLGD